MSMYIFFFMSVNLYEYSTVIILRELLAHELERVHDVLQLLVNHHAVAEYIRCHARIYTVRAEEDPVISGDFECLHLRFSLFRMPREEASRNRCTHVVAGIVVCGHVLDVLVTVVYVAPAVSALQLYHLRRYMPSPWWPHLGAAIDLCHCIDRP